MWKPIESAPKDGSYVDLSIGGYREADCKYLNGEWVKWDYAEAKYCCVGIATHFCEIVEPPKCE